MFSDVVCILVCYVSVMFPGEGGKLANYSCAFSDGR